MKLPAFTLAVLALSVTLPARAQPGPSEEPAELSETPAPSETATRTEPAAPTPSESSEVEPTASSPEEPAGGVQLEPLPTSDAPDIEVRPKENPEAPEAATEGSREEARADEAPLPRNTIQGHLFLSVRGGLAAPFGKIARNTLQTEYAGVGWGFGADAGVGVGRDVVLGVYGDLLPLGTQPNCPDCSPLSAGVGAFVRYHLVQGLNFDPWASFGMGYRSLSLTEQGQDRSYAGLEWLRITFGGDFYPSRYVGFGPYMELGAGSFFSVPDDQRAAGVHYRFQMGLRIAVDFMGRY